MNAIMTTPQKNNLYTHIILNDFLSTHQFNINIESIKNSTFRFNSISHPAYMNPVNY